MIVEVALNLPIRKSFDYHWPDKLTLVPEKGLQVLVPLEHRKRVESSFVLKNIPELLG